MRNVLDTATTWFIGSLIYYILIFPGGRSIFRIDKRYPHGEPGTIPPLVLQKEKSVEFNCSSVDELINCQWKGPFSRRLCQIGE